MSNSYIHKFQSLLDNICEYDEKNLRMIQDEFRRLHERYADYNINIVAKESLAECFQNYINFLCIYYENNQKFTDIRLIEQSLNQISNLIEITKTKYRDNIFLPLILRPLLERVVNMSDDIKLVKLLLKFLNITVQNSDVKYLAQFVKANTFYCSKLCDILPVCGDYSYQATIMETLYRFCNDDALKKYVDIFFPENLILQKKFLSINRKTFDTDTRKFLYILNERYKNVYSFIADYVTVDGYKLIAPNGSTIGADQIWVDFNVKSKTINIFFDKKSVMIMSEEIVEDDDSWDVIIFENRNIQNFSYKKEKLYQNSQKLNYHVLTFNLSDVIDTTASLLQHAQMLTIYISSKDVFKVLSQNILPNLLETSLLDLDCISSQDTEIPRSSTKRNNSIYMPLNITSTGNKTMCKSIASDKKSLLYSHLLSSTSPVVARSSYEIIDVRNNEKSHNAIIWHSCNSTRKVDIIENKCLREANSENVDANRNSLSLMDYDDENINKMLSSNTIHDAATVYAPRVLINEEVHDENESLIYVDSNDSNEEDRCDSNLGSSDETNINMSDNGINDIFHNTEIEADREKIKSETPDSNIFKDSTEEMNFVPPIVTNNKREIDVERLEKPEEELIRTITKEKVNEVNVFHDENEASESSNDVEENLKISSQNLIEYFVKNNCIDDVQEKLHDSKEQEDVEEELDTQISVKEHENSNTYHSITKECIVPSKEKETISIVRYIEATSSIENQQKTCTGELSPKADNSIFSLDTIAVNSQNMNEVFQATDNSLVNTNIINRRNEKIKSIRSKLIHKIPTVIIQKLSMENFDYYIEKLKELQLPIETGDTTRYDLVEKENLGITNEKSCEFTMSENMLDPNVLNDCLKSLYTQNLTQTVDTERAIGKEKETNGNIQHEDIQDDINTVKILSNVTIAKSFQEQLNDKSQSVIGDSKIEAKSKLYDLTNVTNIEYESGSLSGNAKALKEIKNLTTNISTSNPESNEFPTVLQQENIYKSKPSSIHSSVTNRSLRKLFDPTDTSHLECDNNDDGKLSTITLDGIEYDPNNISTSKLKYDKFKKVLQYKNKHMDKNSNVAKQRNKKKKTLDPELENDYLNDDEITSTPAIELEAPDEISMNNLEDTKFKKASLQDKRNADTQDTFRNVIIRKKKKANDLTENDNNFSHRDAAKSPLFKNLEVAENISTRNLEIKNKSNEKSTNFVNNITIIGKHQLRNQTNEDLGVNENVSRSKFEKPSQQVNKFSNKSKNNCDNVTKQGKRQLYDPTDTTHLEYESNYLNDNWKTSTPLVDSQAIGRISRKKAENDKFKKPLEQNYNTDKSSSLLSSIRKSEKRKLYDSTDLASHLQDASNSLKSFSKSSMSSKRSKRHNRKDIETDLPALKLFGIDNLTSTRKRKSKNNLTAFTTKSISTEKSKRCTKKTTSTVKMSDGTNTSKRTKKIVETFSNRDNLFGELSDNLSDICEPILSNIKVHADVHVENVSSTRESTVKDINGPKRVLNRINLNSLNNNETNNFQDSNFEIAPSSTHSDNDQLKMLITTFKYLISLLKSNNLKEESLELLLSIENICAKMEKKYMRDQNHR